MYKKYSLHVFLCCSFLTLFQLTSCNTGPDQNISLTIESLASTQAVIGFAQTLAAEQFTIEPSATHKVIVEEFATSTPEPTATLDPNGLFPPSEPNGVQTWDPSKVKRNVIGTPPEYLFSPLYPSKKVTFEYDSSVWYETGYVSVSKFGILQHRTNEGCNLRLVGYYTNTGGSGGSTKTIINGNEWIFEGGIRVTLPGIIELFSFCSEDKLEDVLSTIKVDGQPLNGYRSTDAYKYFSCPDSEMPLLLKPGDGAFVAINSVNFRSYPNMAQENIKGSLPQGTYVEIKDGPYCVPSDGSAYVMWEVYAHPKKSDVITGFVAESFKNYYILEKQ